MIHRSPTECSWDSSAVFAVGPELFRVFSTRYPNMAEKVLSEVENPIASENNALSIVKDMCKAYSKYTETTPECKVNLCHGTDMYKQVNIFSCLVISPTH